MLINGKTGNCNGQQNRKTKTENLTAPLCYRNATHHNTIFSKHNTKFSSSVFGFGHLYSPSIKVLDYYDKTGRDNY